MKLHQRTAIISGASLGLGFEIAKQFVMEGAHIVICARNKKPLIDAQQALLKIAKKNNSKVLALATDVSNPDQVEQLIQLALTEFKEIHILIANAGIYGSKGPVELADWEEWSKTIDINLKGSVLLCRAVLAHFKQQRYGKIIVVSGGGATKPMPYLSAYAASKAGLVRFAETLAKEVSAYNIDVNALAPGALNTRFLNEILVAGAEQVGDDHYRAALKQKQNGGVSLNLGAALCTYLASQESDGITGKLISAPFDPWQNLTAYKEQLKNSDIYTLRRIVPKDRDQYFEVVNDNQKKLNIAIIGCGLMGQRRAAHLGAHAKLIACSDCVLEKAHTLAKAYPETLSFEHWQDLFANIEIKNQIDIIIIATPHAALAPITLAAIEAGKPVLIEKPGARHTHELDPVIAAAKEKGILVRVGFNHRYQRTIRKARELIEQDLLGELMFIRGRYGHGGRKGYDQEWRAQAELSGGGELIDQGVHLIDLARSFLGEFTEVHGYAHTYFWNMPVDDNGFMLLKTAKKQVAQLQVSCTEWKNTFSFEIYGQKGKIDITGLGGSYGTPRIAFYKMSAALEPPETIIWEYPMSDDSLTYELNEFIEDIQHCRQPNPGLTDAKAALEIVNEIYRISSSDHR